jgi:hypothetical protein
MAESTAPLPSVARVNFAFIAAMHLSFAGNGFSSATKVAILLSRFVQLIWKAPQSWAT